MKTMGSLGLDSLKERFTSLLQSAEPRVLPEFVAWLDLTLTQYKLAGCLYSFPNYSFVDTSSHHIYQYCKDTKFSTTTTPVEPSQTQVTPSHQVSETKLSLPHPDLSHSNSKYDLTTQRHGNSALARLLADNKSNTTDMVGSKLTLKVPSVPTTASTYLNSPVSQQGSPPPGSTAIKTDSYSALRSLLSSSARTDLAREFSDHASSDSESKSTSFPEERGSKGYDCLACGKTFLHRSSFRRHMKIHEGVFSHYCDKCHRKFTRKEHFLRHKCSSLKVGDFNHDEDDITDRPYIEDHVSGSDMASKWNQNIPTSVDTAMSSQTSQNAPPMSPVDMSSKWSDISSVSSGPPSPQLYHPESRRKKSAPRKFVSTDSSPQHDYLSDLDESIYDGAAVKTESGALDFSMKSKKGMDGSVEKPIVHRSDLCRPALSQTTLDLSRKEDVYQKCPISAVPTSTSDVPVIVPKERLNKNNVPKTISDKCLDRKAVPKMISDECFDRNAVPKMISDERLNNNIVRTMVSEECVTPVNADEKLGPHSPHNQRSPPSGFRIGDLIESAVTKYHSMIEPSAPNLDVTCPAKLDKFTREFQANNMPDAEQDQEDYINSNKEKSATKISDIKNGDSNYLATETGTYQITTEESENNLHSDTPNKVIKVVKQGNYLKLKKEAQLIDGELRFICPHCNKVFHRSSNFSRHMRIHRGVFSYICSACNRGFYRKEHFDKHKCYRKAMATTWERKTRVEMDKEGEIIKQEQVTTDEEGHTDHMTDDHVTPSHDNHMNAQDYVSENESHQHSVLIAQNEH